MMNLHYFYQQSIFVLNVRYIGTFFKYLYITYLRVSGMEIGKGTYFSKVKVTWPHQVSIGNYCRLEHNIYFHFDGIYSKGPSIVIRNNVFIGNNSEFNITDKITIGNITA